jgi:hypothetical protein
LLKDRWDVRENLVDGDYVWGIKDFPIDIALGFKGKQGTYIVFIIYDVCIHIITNKRINFFINFVKNPKSA